MSFINNIEIKNFKSIRHQKIEGCKRINVFIGGPNVGKSNILEALSLFSVESTKDNFSDFVRVGKATTLFNNGNIENPIQIIINEYFRSIFKYSKNEIKAKFELDRYNKGFEEIDNQKNNKDSGFIYERGNYSINVNNFEIKDNHGPISFPVFKFPTEDNLLKQGDRKNIFILKYIFKKDLKYESIEPYQLKQPYGQNIFEIISTTEKLNKFIIEIFENYNLKFLYDSESQEFKILKITGDKIFTVPYFMVADTLQRLIFHKAAIMSNTDSVLLFEEPEAQMYPPYISKFTSDIMYDENNNQFFIATHSPYVVNDFMENLKINEYSIYTVGYDKETGETLIRRMTEEELHEIYQYGVDIFMNLENYLPHAQHQ